MTRLMPPALFALLVAIVSARAQDQFTPEVIERGKKATALVQIGLSSSASAFCIDKSGLFVTTAHILENGMAANYELKVVLDTGLETERALRAKVLRRDDKLDLALLQVDNTVGARDSRGAGQSQGAEKGALGGVRLTDLEFGKESTLIELAPILTFGYPYRPMLRGGGGQTPTVSVFLNHITALRQDQGQLLGIQFDNQLDSRLAGGPVVDKSGRVIGVVATAATGTAMNVATPVGRLSEFLAAPGIVFDPGRLTDTECADQVSWTVKLQPPPKGKLPEGVSVSVTLVDGPGKTRTFAAQPADAGSFKVTLRPQPPSEELLLAARFHTGRPTVTIRTKDREITESGDATLNLRTRDREVGIRRSVREAQKKIKLSELRVIVGGAKPHAETLGGQTIDGVVEGLGRARVRSGRNINTIDLRTAAEIKISSYAPRVSEVTAVVEAKQDARVLATLRQRINVTLTPPPELVAAMKNAQAKAASPKPSAPVNDGVLKLGGALDVDGVPKGAGLAIKPPTGDIPAARLTATVAGEAVAQLERRLEAKISDVSVGGGGRYLLLTQKAARKLAVFDVNAADVVKTIPLPSPNCLVAAGAKKFLIAMPDQKRIERWDLAKLERDGDSRPLPISGPLYALALGSDSDGPALAVWFGDPKPFGFLARTRCSFIDLESLAVLRLDAAHANAGQPRGGAPVSAGSFGLGSSEERPHVRASAGGGLFGIWRGGGFNEFQTVVAHGASIQQTALSQGSGYLVPGPDDRTVYTATFGRLHADGRLAGRSERIGDNTSEPELTLPSNDPAYYLSIAGLRFANSPDRRRVEATLSVRSSGDGARVATVHGLDEMASVERNAYARDDFTVDKRFHLVPGAHLLITIPLENDRLVLRRLDIEDALYRSDSELLVATSSPSLLASAGQAVQHRIVAWSKKGGLRYALASGPLGMNVAPDGILTWNVPRQQQSGEVTAVIKARDAQGQEIFQTLRIHVKGANAGRTAAPGGPLLADDAGLLRLGASLDITGKPLGSGREIRPPQAVIPAARLTPGAEKGSEPPLVRQLGGTIGDIAAGGGRFLLVPLKEARKLAVFDVNAADVVKTIPLSSPSALVAAGANKLLIAYPEEKLLERWDLATLEREGGSHISPIDGWIRALALGCDSDGPALALWYPAARGYPKQMKASKMYVRDPEARFSFIDLDRLTVLRVGSIEIPRQDPINQGDSLSASGGSFMLTPDLGNRYKVYLRASAGGGVFEVACLPMQFFFLKAEGKELRLVSHEVRYEADPPRGFITHPPIESKPSEMRPIYIRAVDPAYYLGIRGLPRNVAGSEGGLGNTDAVVSPQGEATVAIHAAGDGSRLFTIYGLDEMAKSVKMNEWFHDDLTIEKRFHFVPAAKLFITVPPTNDRLVVRHVDMDLALAGPGNEQLVTLSSPALTAKAGAVLEHRIVARSKKGRVTYALSDGPDGLTVAEDGMLKWAIPARLKGQSVTVVVTVSDASGDQRFHTIKIRVE